MSNEAIVINQANLYIHVSGRRITALPDTGTILSVERLTPTAGMIGGLHNTSLHIINSGKGRRCTINVVPGSADDVFLFNAIKAIENFGQLLSLSVKYEDTTFVSGSCSIESEPTRNFNADGAEMLAYPLLGVFPIAIIGSLANPGTLTSEQIDSI